MAGDVLPDHIRLGALRSMRRVLLAFALLITSAAAGAHDPPARVGRLSYTEGAVSIHLGDQPGWVPATVNYPVTTGESFWTEPAAKAEIQIGPTELRLDQTSELDVARLDDTTIALQLDQGTLNLHLWQVPSGGISVSMPPGRVVLTAPGSYNVDAGEPTADAPADHVQITVLEGAARFEGEHGAVEIGPSETAVITGEPMNVTLAAASSSPFDDWALARERREVAAQQPGYVAPTVTGYQDLNEYGSWRYDPNYGGVWYPAGVPDGWAPYRYGHWAFVPTWGWTWIDDAAWGFAPFHYGRWLEIGGRWGWVPGALAAQPVYAPALVAFIGDEGWGINWAAGPAVAAVGWVALAPGEVYHPYYRASATYIRNVNVTNVSRTTINNVPVNTNVSVGNFRNRQAATVVPATAFTGAAPVHRAMVAVPEAQLRQESVAPSIAHLQPGAAARVGREVPAAAASSAPQPNALATIARTRVAAMPPPVREAEPSVSAPGPRRDMPAHREVKSPSPAGPPALPQGQATEMPPASTTMERGAVPGPSAPSAPGAPPAGTAIKKAPSAPSGPAPQVAGASPRISAPTSTKAAAGPHLQPQVQPVRAPLPPIQVAHPVQQTHIAPTPQAWARVPGAPPRPSTAQPARAAPPPAKEPPPKKPPAKSEHQ